MPFYADLHLHSKFARATSADADLEHMALWAAKKGVSVLGTGDFTHPGWFAELRDKLKPAEPGLFRLRSDLERWVAQEWPAFARQPTRFLFQVEIATIYKKGERTRKVHHCLYVPDLVAAERLIQRLSRIGNLKSDGRPILGLDSRDLLEITLEAGEGAYLIPAHIWTPWFAALGSKSGFDSIEECYGDLAPHIFALETGLSSDPPMNWRLSQLDRYRLVSNSDAHSPAKIGREACVFDCALDYSAMRRALATGLGYGGTVEFFPEEGKYHLDGHRNCGVCFGPEETRKHGGVCPICGKELTVGVMHRVAELADRPDGARHENAKPFRSLIPLAEVLAEIQRVGPGSKKVAEAYEQLVRGLGPELFILEQASLEDVRAFGSTLLAEGLARMRQARVLCQPGYDGEYGVIRLFTDDELAQGNAVSLLFELPQDRAGGSPAQAGFLPAAASKKHRRNARNCRPDMPSALPATAPPVPASNPPATALQEAPPPYLSLPCDPLAGLDPDQRAAAEITAGPLLIIAGPGTGKTRTLTHRIAHLVGSEGVPAGQCLAVTFTNRAANEMKERLRKLIPSAAGALLVTTFHGLGHHLLQEHGARLGLPTSFRVASETERKALLTERLKLSDRNATRFLKQLSVRKRAGRAAPGEPSENGGGVAGTPRPAEEEQLASTTYERALYERGWLDFDDLVNLAVELLEGHSDLLACCRGRFRWVSVDEFQDIDERQYRLVTLLVPPDGNLCVIGDPDQAIYSFRGGAPRFFQQFAADYPAARTVHLCRNYRSGRAIVQGALQAIAPATLVTGRTLEALNADAARITIHESPTDKAEAEFVVHTLEKLIGGSGFFSLDSGRVEGSERGGDYSFSDFAVLYRMGAQAEVIGDALARAGIPCQRHSHAPLAEHEAVQALLANARDQANTLSVLDRLKAALGDPKAEIRNPREARNPKSETGALSGHSESQFLSDFVLRISELASRCGADLARFEAELALLSDLDLWDPRADRVSLLTLHASKGLEFAVVFIVGCEDGLLPLRWGAGADEASLDEERRLFFVGMTRARERLFLTHARKRLWRGQFREQAVSPFVTAIRQELLERSHTPTSKRPDKPLGVQLDLF